MAEVTLDKFRRWSALAGCVNAQPYCRCGQGQVLSPRTRGWSVDVCAVQGADHVFPALARAGVVAVRHLCWLHR